MIPSGSAEVNLGWWGEGGSHDPVGDACDNVTGEEGRGILSRWLVLHLAYVGIGNIHGYILCLKIDKKVNSAIMKFWQSTGIIW